MYRLSVLKNVPEGSVGITYVQGESISVGRNVSLVDYSAETQENVSGFFGQESCVTLTGGGAFTPGSDDFSLSNVSLDDRGNRRAYPLYYKYTVGEGSYYVVAHDASSRDVPSEAVKSTIQVLDRFGRPFNGLIWDIRAEHISSNRYSVVFYTRDRIKNDTIQIRYKAYNVSTGATTDNRTEVANLAPLFTKPGDYNGPSSTGGYNFFATPKAPALTIYYVGTTGNGQYQVDTNTVKLKDGADTYDLDVTAETAESAAAKINENIGTLFVAVPMSPHSDSFSISNISAGVYITLPRTGVTLYHSNKINLRYESSSRLRVDLPYDEPPSRPWYPRVRYGEFSISVADLVARHDYPGVPNDAGTYQKTGTLYYGVPEYDRQSFSSQYTANSAEQYRYVDVKDEAPKALTERMFQLARFPLHADTVTVRINGVVQDVVDRVDLWNGVVFLDETLKSFPNVTVDYTYEERYYLYRNLDLNPLNLYRRMNTSTDHAVWPFGKYIGVYAFPHVVITGSDRKEFDRAIYHVIKDTVQELVELFENPANGSGGSGGTSYWDPNPILLGVFRVDRATDVDQVSLTDVRVQGGKPKDEVFGGRKVNLNGSIVLKYPEELLGTGEAPIELAVPVSVSGFQEPTGIFDEDDIRSRTKRYVAGGVVTLLQASSDL